MSVQVNEVTRTYGNQVALNKVSFRVERGITGFIGPNGAGKSTMMKIITGYLRPDAGTVLVNDMDVSTNPLAVRQSIGYLPEHNPLYLNMYVREYLEFTGGLYGLNKGREARIREVIERTGLGPEQHKRIGVLSKGYRQRVGLAQAILHDPAILILDEPTSGLDPNQVIGIRQLISDLGKDKTVMLSTHIMQEVEAICTSIILINKGQIVADEHTEQLIQGNTPEMMVLEVEFNAPVEKAALLAIPGVQDGNPLGPARWVIAGTVNPDIRSGIFSFAVKNNLVVLSMQRREKSMEEVFRELTQ
ncbi:MAG: gliding motility-associated ABC transporter ATP-binding subunit GldA [Bacteroidales bacterium]